MKSYSPTTPSRRHMKGYDFSRLSKTEPLKSATTGLIRSWGRNNKGRITSKYRGGGAKRLYREIDFKQNKIDVPGKVFSIEYDPNRTTRIARINYADGDKRYVLAPQDLKAGDEIITAEKAPLRPGNRMKLKNIPQGSMVHNVELRPGQGGKLVRSAGSGAMVLASEGGYVQLVMPSSEIRIISGESSASIGQLSNTEHNSIVLGKAGRTRWLGRRPKVRGTAMNPVDHPYGGGEGKQGRGTRRPKTAQGKITGGRKTRNKKKKSGKFIIRRRHK
ncbi:MAG: 50S ribosomal protein L2 [Candidatus Yanofskybacteria bacterium RIFCSPHIGHO2_01_FULL_43_42]|uniref:Large ribosomal subunit protein uL2 n=1 Tax=Candidatus Yanofskybacteria bacterium RIFCSPLOWO2_01_FULL_43_22 TaxID=1802695 RepID=A0A1F8GEL0_9BACT|nr:MAG: 50S ribosomal protein L2 [Candidatus Yanofskybacteria bacterium RIFCSPHIGHO2_01_FULL_43_42]OGN12574.1 MAG: 50S ribosomal protein L2 [Candidatus Yanofskybacteria bacterium RIFCSPHIGHO2_02_FULL_43_17]OGN23721.1 MAG: 50S ribosomal protein L2 [Candidatus Yanofskybacteria bacterium RIFCSPLOWO2_01_FULL_43_22]